MMVTFSILYGSMVGATWRLTTRCRYSATFQYPLRIDGRCNSVCARWGTCWVWLSVSSTDRWSVQHWSRDNPRNGSPPFSILYGSMVGATFGHRAARRGRQTLSVSSTDRWSVQPSTGGIAGVTADTFSILYGSMVGATRFRELHQADDQCFQYPLRIDGRCNPSWAPGSLWAPTLSVSSTDRWSVQLLCALCALCGYSVFQYPLRIDGRCNRQDRAYADVLAKLSVSSTDRWSVQPLGAAEEEHRHRGFQYPLRIDGRCNDIQTGRA